jgi:hypothetical protein
VLPGLPDEVLHTLLARVCRVAPPRSADRPAEGSADRSAGAVHPADSAVASGVLVGVLLHRLDRDPDSLDPGAPDPLPARDQPSGSTA